MLKYGRGWRTAKYFGRSSNARYKPANTIFSHSIHKESQATRNTISLDGRTYERDEWTNVPASILELLPRKLHLKRGHPIEILRRQIESGLSGYTTFNDYSPVVSTNQNFDSLGFPAQHVGRSKSDTYYVDTKTVLRTHTSAHQADTFKNCSTPGFLISADVYRRDEIDKSHYPVFHQMEGACSWKVSEDLVAAIELEIAEMSQKNIRVEDANPPNHPQRNPLQTGHNRAQSEAVARHLKRTIEGIAAHVFSSANTKEPLQVRWIEAYFPFTSPSWELEIFWDGAWLELCGCGVVQQTILDQAGLHDRIGWAFGLGLERIAMVLFDIPDIRLFWSKDERFSSQFVEGRVSSFVPYSKYPANKKDISFWVEGKVPYQENDFMEIVRTIGGDLVEDVTLVDSFVQIQTGRKSLCYRINYRSMDRSLTNEEINGLQERIRLECANELKVVLR